MSQSTEQERGHRKAWDQKHMELVFNRKRHSISETRRKEGETGTDLPRFRNEVLLTFSFATEEVMLSAKMEKVTAGQWIGIVAENEKEATQEK